MSEALIENKPQYNDKSQLDKVPNFHPPDGHAKQNQSGRVFKIIVIGDSNVGKTCLTFRFCGGKFPSRTEATIGVDFREKAIDIEGEIIKIQLWDTAGQERFRKSMVQHYYRNVQAIIFVYDVTRMSTFNSLPQWIEECNQHNIDMKNIPRILVGNKCDNAPHDISVSTNLAQRFADQYNMPLFETSAKDDSSANHVEAIFWTLAHRLKTSKPMIVPLFDDSGDFSYDYARNQKIISVGQRKSNGSIDLGDERSGCMC